MPSVRHGPDTRRPQLIRRIYRGAARLAGTFVAAAALAAVAASASPYDRFPQAAAAYAVKVDGELVWGRALDAARPPASLTKLLSALVLLDTGWNPDRSITVSAQAAAIEGSRVGLHAGETLRAGDALTAMLVRSGNDACLALVEQAAGDIASFALRMNARAAALGMNASHFVHPCGLDAAGQKTTVRDLLRLAQAAAANRDILLRAGALEAQIRTLQGRRLEFHNSNAIIGREPAAVGLKSGYTNLAGRCVIALAEKDGHRVLVVMLDASERWWAVSGLLEEGFTYARRKVPLPDAAAP